MAIYPTLMKALFLFSMMSLLLTTGCGKDESSSTSSDTNTPETANPLEEIILITPSGDPVQTSLAYKKTDLQRGLSGIPSQDFNNDQGKLFYYFTEATRTFWMPNTFFALDVFYLNSELEIERIVRDLPAYNGTNEEDIPRAPAIKSRHVLEMKATSPIADDLQVGDKLIWQSSLTMEETEEAMKETL